MEALAAVSLVGNIFQFVEFSHKLLRGTKELYHSQSESLQDTQDLETLTQGLQQICTALQDKSSSTNVGTATPQQRQQQAALRRLAKGCESSAKELLSALQKLKAKDPKSKWSCFEAALATTWTQSRINAMQKRVEGYSSQLLLQLNFMGIDEPKCGSSRFTALFDDLSNKSTALHTDMTEKIISLGAEILKSLQDIQLSLVALMKTNHALLAPPTDTAHCLHVDNLTRSTTIVTEFAVALHLLKNLSFEGIDSRRYSIHDANANTLQWVFPNKFQSWTQSSEPIFWISGKPGSGKSTLMKWLAENKQTFDALRQWADTGTLITASYFFWCNGTDLQRSQEGLLRALLYNVLRNQHNLIKTVLFDDWKMSNSLLATGTESIHEWSRSRLQAIFRQLSVLDPTQTKFCFFVDGLDEYNGDYDDLIGTLRSLINPNVKLCISSRPLNVFEQSFGYNPQYKIYMEDLNAKDIQQYVKDNLTTRSDFKALQMDIFEAARISNEILSKSQGVFLWVALVVRSLVDGLRNRDIFSLLFKRLHDFPADLEDYFRNIFDSLGPFYKTLSAHMFKVALASHSPLHPLVYWFLDALEDDSAMALTMSIKALTQQEITSHIEEVKVRINGRCKGLLEVNKHSIGANPAVDFLHRSVTDWLKTAEMEKMLSTWQCENFNAHLYVCKASLAALKSASTTLSDHGSGHIMLCDSFLMSAKGVEDAMNESPTAYIDTFEHTISEHIRSRPNISSPWLFWYSTNLLSVAARLDLKLFVKDRLSQESKRTTSDNGFSKKLKMEMLRGVPEDQPLTGVSPSPEMMEIILPVGPSVVFDQTLQSSLCNCIPVKGLDRNRVISIIEFICKHCIFEASKSGVPVNKQLVKMLDGFLFENQLEEVYNTIRRGNRWHNNPVRRLWRLVDRSES